MLQAPTPAIRRRPSCSSTVTIARRSLGSSRWGCAGEQAWCRLPPSLSLLGCSGEDHVSDDGDAAAAAAGAGAAAAAGGGGGGGGGGGAEFIRLSNKTVEV